MRQGLSQLPMQARHIPTYPAHAPSPTWLSTVFLGLGAAAVAVYFVVGPFAQMFVWDAIGYGAVVAIVVATRVRRPATATAWALFAAGVFCNVTGDAVNSAYLELSSREVPVPYYSDIFYLSSYFLLAAGVLGFLRGLGRVLSLPDVIDASVYATGLSLLAWGPVFDAQVHQTGVSALGHAVLLMYPAGDILVLAVFGLFVAVGGWRPAWIRLLGAGLVSFLVADVLYSSSFVSYSAGSAVDAGWLCAYVLFGAAALRPGGPVTDSDRGLLLHAAWRRVGLVAAVVAAIGVIFYDVAAGESLSWGEAGLAGILIGLVVLRLVVGMREFERAHETEVAARRAVERSRAELAETEARFRALTERGFDLVTIQDAGRLLRYVSPSAEQVLGYLPDELVDTDALELVHPDDREAVVRSAADTLLGPETATATVMRLRRKDGSWRVVEATGLNLLDDPAVHGVVTISRDVTERAEAQEALRASEERFRLIAERASDIVFVGSGPQMQLEYVSPAFERILGFTAEEAYADAAFWTTHTHPDDIGLIVLPEPDGPPVRNVARWLRKDGGWTWIETTATATRDDDGRVVIRGAGRDVSEQQSADEALQASEQRFRNIAAQLFDIVMIVDAEGVVRYANDALIRVLGLPPEEYVGRSGLENIHPDDVERVAEALAGGLPTPRAVVTMEFRARHADGSWRLLEATGQNLLDDPAIGGVLITSRDITEQRRVDAALRESEEWFRLLADSSPDVIFRRPVSPAGPFNYVSPSILPMTGYTPEELCSDPEILFKLLHPADASIVAEASRQVTKAGAPIVQFRWVRKDGETIWVETRLAPIADETEAIVAVQGIVRDVTAQRAAREALRESEERFRSIAENANDVILRRPPNLDDPYDYVSPAVFAMTGYTPEELCSTPGILRRIVHPDDIALLADLGNAELHAAPVLIRWIRKNGETILTEGRGSIVTDEHGAPSVQAVVRDVTERVRAEEHIRNSEERFRNVTEQSFDAVSIVDELGIFRYQNAALTTLLGYEVDEILGTSAFDLVHPDDVEGLQTVLGELLLAPRSSTQATFRMRHADGTWRTMEAIGQNLFDDPGIAGILITTRDVTERRLAEEHLRESEERFRAAFESAPMGVAALRLDGTLASVNEAFATLLGVGRDELEGRHLTEFAPAGGAEDTAARFRHVIETGEPMVSLETRAVTPLGDELWLLVSSALVRDADGAPSYVILQGFDVSDRKRAETERESALALVSTQNEMLAEADRMKDELISVVSHDLRTPLTSIMGYLELVMNEEAGPLNSEQQQFLEVVRRSADRLLTLVNDLLFISRTETGSLALDLTEVDLGAVAIEAIEGLQPKAAQVGVELTLEADPIPAVLADRARMTEVLENLLTNALKFTPSGGSVEVRLAAAGAHVGLDVADTGVGIADTDQQHLFQRFFRSARTQGTPGIGLGLSIVKAIVEAHGGRVTLTSTVDEGTTFHVEIPLVPPAPAKDARPVSTATAEG